MVVINQNTSFKISGFTYTGTDTQLNYTANVNAGIAQPSKALILDSTSNLIGINSLNLNSLSTTSLIINGTTITNSIINNLAALDGVSAGTASASKALILDSSRNIININSLTATNLIGTLLTASQTNITTVGALTGLISNGNVNIAQHNGTSTGLFLNSVLVTASATELNRLKGITATTLELNKLSGVLSTTAEINKLNGLLSTTAELNILNGVTTSSTEINYLSGTNVGTAIANKALIVGAGPDVSGFRNINMSGTVTSTAGRFMMGGTTWGLSHKSANTIVEMVSYTDGANNNYIGSYTSHDFSLATATLRRLVVKSDGKIGINTTVPIRQFDINAADGNCLRLIFNNNSGTGTVYCDQSISSTGDVSLTAAGTAPGYTLTGGRVLINNSTASTSTSTGALQVLGGLGIAGNINSGGNITTSGTILINKTNSANAVADFIGSNTYLNGSHNRVLRCSGSNVSPVILEVQVNQNTSLTSTNSAWIGTTTTNDFQLGSNNLSRMTILSSGNIGIGTTTPSYGLDINGSLNATSLFLSGTQVTATANQLNILNGATTSTTEINTLAGVVAGTITASKAVVVSSSRHIGTFGNITLDGVIRILRLGDGLRHDSDSNANSNTISIRTITDTTSPASGAIGTLNSHAFHLYTNGSTNKRLTITNSGNVGIGTTTPNYALEVNGIFDCNQKILIGTSTDTATTRLISALDSTLIAGDNRVFTLGRANSANNQSEFGFRYIADGSTSNYLSLGLHTSPTSLNILGSGNVGIGTSTPTEKLEINGNLLSSGEIKTSIGRFWMLNTEYGLSHANTTGGTAEIITYSNGIDDNSIGTFSYNSFHLATSNTNRLSITADGDVSINNTTTSTSATTGCLTLAGGLGISDNIYIAKSTVLGTTSRTNLTNWGITGIQFATSTSSYTLTAGSTPTTLVANSFAQPTFAATASTTLTYAATVYIHNSPTLTNLTATENHYALYINAGRVKIATTTASTSTTTGALIISGGVGISGDSTIGGILSITNTTASTNSTTGALKISGGLGVAGAINIGSTLGVTGAISGSNTITTTVSGDGLRHSNGTINLISNVVSANNIGYLGTSSAHPLGLITSSISRVNIDTSGNVGINTTTPDARLEVNDVNGLCLRLSYNDLTNVDQTVKSDGTLYIKAASNDVFIGNASNTSQSLYIGPDNITGTSGLLRIVNSGGINYIQSGTNINNNSAADLFISNMKNTTSTSTRKFMIKADGKVGIQTSAPTRQLEINASDGNCLRLTYNDSDGSALNYTDFSVGIDGDLTINSSGGSINLTNTTDSTSSTTGALVISGGLGISDITDATSSTNGGAFTLAGGAAIAKKLFVGGTLTITGSINGTLATAAQTNITSVGTLTGLTSSGAVTITNNTSSSSTTTGALKVTGGIGCAENINAAGYIKTTYLQVGTSTDTTRLISALDSAQATSTTKYITLGKSATNGNQAELGFFYNGSDDLSNALTFGFYGGEKARLTKWGGLLLNTTTETWNSNKSRLAINGDHYTEYLMTFNTTNATNSRGIAFLYNSTIITGGISMGSGYLLFTGSSDYRLKKNISIMQDNALSKIKKIRPVDYKWISNNNICNGFIAHELQEIYPYAVDGEKDAINADGSINPQGVDYGRITPLLTKGIQEQQQIIEELQNENISLKKQLQSILERLDILELNKFNH
jgi:hypothetical protein